MPTDNADNAVDLMYAMALRARQLMDMPARQLRLSHGTADAKTTAIAESRGMTLGQVLEAVLTDEFEDTAKRLDQRKDADEDRDDEWWVVNKNGALLVLERAAITRNITRVAGPYASKTGAKAAWAEILDRSPEKPK